MPRTANIVSDTHFFISLSPSARDRHETEMHSFSFCRWIGIVFYPVSLRLFWPVTKIALEFYGALHRELLSLVQAEVFLCSLTSGSQKPFHLLDWSPGCPLWHVMTHTASFLLFVSVAEGNWWCCQDVLYTIKHRAERRLSASPYMSHHCLAQQFYTPCSFFDLPVKDNFISCLWGGGGDFRRASATFSNAFWDFRHFSVQESIKLADGATCHFTRPLVFLISGQFLARIIRTKQEGFSASKSLALPN